MEKFFIHVFVRFRTLRIIYNQKMMEVISEGGGGLHVLLCDRAKLFYTSESIIKARDIIFDICDERKVYYDTRERSKLNEPSPNRCQTQSAFLCQRISENEGQTYGICWNNKRQSLSLCVVKRPHWKRQPQSNIMVSERLTPLGIMR